MYYREQSDLREMNIEALKQELHRLQRRILRTGGSGRERLRSNMIQLALTGRVRRHRGPISLCFGHTA